jgi:hypothetical protein
MPRHCNPARTGKRDVVEIADSAVVRRASPKDAIGKRAQALAPLTAVAASQWRALADRAIEPNGYYLPG